MDLIIRMKKIYEKMKVVIRTEKGFTRSFKVNKEVGEGRGVC